MTVITLSGLVVGRGGRAMTPPLDLDVPGGAALAVTGPNGAGKSTFLRSLAGLLPPLAGMARLSGVPAADGEPATLAEACHYLGHRNGLKPQATLRANLTFWHDYLGPRSAGPGAIEAAVDAFGLEGLEDIPVAYLSAGQQRRGALCRLLVRHRPLWLLDEPLTALDGAAQARFSALAAKHLAEGGIVIAATHHPLDLPGTRELRIAPPAPMDGDPSAEAWSW